jgi:DNA-directed RNA polymerase sigma subunit (sigma70/sigma32)
MTQHEVAEELQISRSKVDAIEKLALRKLKVRINRIYKKEDFL